ncbi:MAG: hypothetical protein H7X94_12655 [Vallitaleaceae bacterium]|nr:hypothetical protein [Vallitaleaceae bacterium]
MKYKVVRDKKRGETRIDYFRVIDRNAFRYETLKKLIEAQDLIISIDTNLVKSEQKHQTIAMAVETILKENNIYYEMLPVENVKQKKVLGFPVKTKDEKAFNILFSLKAQDLTKALFDQAFHDSDVLIGINPKKSFEEIFKDLQKGYFTTFFDPNYFEFAVYDSNYISAIRINKVIEDF